MEHRRAAFLWEEAATHRNGMGMENGVHLTVARKHYCTIIKRGAMARARALMAILTGALWLEARIQEDIKGKEGHDTTCKQCGHPRKDEAHMFWGCPPTNASKNIVYGAQMGSTSTTSDSRGVGRLR